ncbi:RNA polymerase sigma factor SigE [Actinotalea sp. M2MS4P-6]|uniref:RNA polymerase sigma factor SigE n=1 Tax=Actinotalea sp. M2MS4P-6 TaxID=2983762 RepID=UPI0021E3F628|nr:RNA polymerase sigma factor SigE [Actinotalea sp. M2MS4P-6]MCV2393477.1 RNA polymerase sigma factor SigE [Actinotalea sp. M2MS4P-6]
MLAPREGASRAAHRSGSTRPPDREHREAPGRCDDQQPGGGHVDVAHDARSGVPGWEQIVAEHSARVYRLAYRLTGNQHDAEDLTQETFVRVFRSLSGYQPGSFEGWLHRITVNLFLDGARRRTRIRMEPLGEDADRLPSQSAADTPERGFEHANLDTDVQRALDRLSPEFRAAVVLCDIEGLSYEEIAVTLGIKMGTVRSRIHRARAQLRAELAHRAPAGATPSTEAVGQEVGG